MLHFLVCVKPLFSFGNFSLQNLLLLLTRLFPFDGLCDKEEWTEVSISFHHLNNATNETDSWEKIYQRSKWS